MSKRLSSLITAYSIFSSIAGSHLNSGNCKKYNNVDFEKVKIKGKSAEEMGTANSRKKKSRKERKREKRKNEKEN